MSFALFCEFGCFGMRVKRSSMSGTLLNMEGVLCLPRSLMRKLSQNLKQQILERVQRRIFTASRSSRPSCPVPIEAAILNRILDRD